MTKEQKRMIEADARKAAALGQDPKTACPYPWHSEEALLWIAAWAVAMNRGVK